MDVSRYKWVESPHTPCLPLLCICRIKIYMESLIAIKTLKKFSAVINILSTTIPLARVVCNINYHSEWGLLFLPAYLQTVNSLPHASWSLGGSPCWGAAWGLDISGKAAKLYIVSLISPPMEVTVYSICATSTNGGHCIQSLCYLH